MESDEALGCRSFDVIGKPSAEPGIIDADHANPRSTRYFDRLVDRHHGDGVTNIVASIDLCRDLALDRNLNLTCRWTAFELTGNRQHSWQSREWMTRQCG